MNPTIAALLSVLRKPQAASAVTRIGKRTAIPGLEATQKASRYITPSALTEHTVRSAPPIFPSQRFFPDMSELVKRHAQLAGTYQKVGAEDAPVLPEHHFRNLLFALGPLSGAATGGASPVINALGERVGKTPIAWKSLLKDLPWNQVGKGALKGVVPGALSGLLSGMVLDSYLQKKLRGDNVEKTAGALGKYAQIGYAPQPVMPAPEDSVSSFDPAQTSLLEQYYQTPLEERPYTPGEQDNARMLQQQYTQATQQQQQPASPQQAPEPQPAQPQGAVPQLTADALEQQLKVEQKSGNPQYDQGSRVNKIRLARMYEQQGMDPVTAMGQSEHVLDQLWQYYRDAQRVTAAIRQATGENWEQQQQVQQQQTQQQQQQATAQQQNQYRQQAAPTPRSQ